MTEKEEFKEIFGDVKNFIGITDTDMMLTAWRCNKLYEWVKEKEPGVDTIALMHFAYWLGRIDGKRRKYV